MNRPVLFALTAGAALILVAAGSGSREGAKPAAAEGPSLLAAKVGQNCIVQFRRNLLGAASPKTIDPTIVRLTGDITAEYAVEGKVSQVSEHWVVIAGEKGEQYYIPRDAILLVVFLKDK